MEEGLYTPTNFYSCGCVISQLSRTGRYSDGMESLGLDPDGVRAVALGLIVGRDDTEYTHLTRAWLDEIAARAGTLTSSDLSDT